MNIKEKILTFFAVLGGILTVVQLYSWLTEPKTLLSATIDLIEYSIPVELSDEFSYNKTREKTNDLLQVIEFQSKNKLADSSKLAIRNFVENKFQLDKLYDFSAHDKTLGILEIKNTGDKEIQDIQIRTEAGFLYEFSNNDGKIYGGVSAGKIKLGNLRPTEELKVRLWNIAFYEDDIRITFPDGAMTPERKERVTGFFAIMTRLFPSLNAFLLLLFFIFVLFMKPIVEVILKRTSSENRTKDQEAIIRGTADNDDSQL